MAAVNAMVCRKVHEIGGAVLHPSRELGQERGMSQPGQRRTARKGVPDSNWKQAEVVMDRTRGDCREEFPPGVTAQLSRVHKFEIPMHREIYGSGVLPWREDGEAAMGPFLQLTSLMSTIGFRR